MDACETLLIMAALLSAIAALLHLGILIGGPSWYQFFGAGRRMVRLAQTGSWYPPIITAMIMAMLFLWALYALSAAHLLMRLPWTKLVLSCVTAAYLLRGIIALPALALLHKKISPFWIWSSAICTVYGLVHLAGVYLAWSTL